MTDQKPAVVYRNRPHVDSWSFEFDVNLGIGEEPLRRLAFQILETVGKDRMMSTQTISRVGFSAFVVLLGAQLVVAQQNVSPGRAPNVAPQAAPGFANPQ